MRAALALAWIGAIGGVLPGEVSAQAPSEAKVAEYKKRVERHYVEAAQAYVEIAWWGRKVGLVPQSTTLFLRAKEAGQGRHQMADNLVSWMEQLGDGFWKVRPKRPPRHFVVDCARKVRLADKLVRKSHLQVAKLAIGVGADQDARLHCEQAIRLGAEVAVGKDGKFELDGLDLPDALGKWLQDRTVATAAGGRVYESAAAAGFRVEGLFEHRDERLAVRTDLGADRAKALHALGAALLPHLEERLDDAPSRQLVLLVFGKRDTYTAYLKSLGIDSAAAGLAEYGSFQTIVCAEGKGEAELQALVLHELSHLCFFGTAPAAMPDWYAEGFAESFGGQGTFAFDGRALTIGGVMAKHRIEALQQAPWSVADLLDADAEALWQQDPATALRFYAAAWAFQRFLRSPGCPWREEFARWEARCRGTVLGHAAGGAQNGPGKASPLAATPRYGDRKPAQALFRDAIGKDLPAIEKAFAAFVRGL
jgi:hypothetical protein